MGIWDWIVVFIVLGIFLGIINMYIIVVEIEIEIEPFDYFFPTTLYEVTEMNIFGCIVVSIILFCINYLWCSIVLIFYFLYWITHIGRKD